MNALLAATLTTANGLQQWSYLVGLLLPLVVALVQQPRWSPHVRAIVGIASCVLAGLVTTYLDTGLSLSDAVGSVARVLVAAQATYVAFWKPTGIAPWFEALTSPATPPNKVAHAQRARRRKHVAA